MVLQKSQLAFCHLQKTGGQTVHAWLASAFDPAEVYPWSEPIKYLSRAHVERYKLIGGHYAAAELLAQASDAKKITILRRPFERIVSLYNFWRAHDPDEIHRTGDLFKLRAHELNFVEFIRSEQPEVMLMVRNGMTAQLGRIDFDAFRPVTEADFEAACQFLKDCFFVGLQEHLPEDVRSLAWKLGLPPPRELAHINSADDFERRQGFRKIGPIVSSLDARPLVEALNEYDVRLYSVASEIRAKALVERETTDEVVERLTQNQHGVRRTLLMPGTNVRFGINEACNAMLISGWSHPETGFVWTDAEYAFLAFSVPQVRESVSLVMEIMPFLNERNPSVNVEFFVNGQSMGCYLFVANDCQIPAQSTESCVITAMRAGEFSSISLTLPNILGSEVSILAHVKRPVSPSALCLSNDNRALGFAIGGLKLW
jgi:hypothetical protein